MNTYVEGEMKNNRAAALAKDKKKYTMKYSSPGFIAPLENKDMIKDLFECYSKYSYHIY